MAVSWIWLPIIGTGKEGDAYRPDLPKEVTHWMVANIENDRVTGAPKQTHVLVAMDSTQAALCLAAKPELLVDKESKDNLAVAEMTKDIRTPIEAILTATAAELVGKTGKTDGK